MKRLMNMKRIIMIFIVGIFLLLLSVNNKLISSSDKSLLSFLSSNKIEEKDISEIANYMYVTMLDKKAKVVATTNPDFEVDSKYSFSDTTKPIVQPSVEDDYFLLFNINDTNGDNGYTKVEENVIYKLDLPDYIVPSNPYEDGVEPNEECTNFTKKGKSIACGGIYQKDGKYTFKVIFNDVLNKKDVKASYQFPMKLNKTIEDIVFTLKTIDFGTPGTIQLFMEKKEEPTPPVVEEKDYDVKFESVGWTSITENYAKWVVTITDKHTDGYKMNGSLYIDFGPYMAMPLDQNHFYENMKMYIDGEELYRSRNGMETTLFQKSNQADKDGYAFVSMLNKESPRLKNTNNTYSFSASQFKIDLSDIVDNVVQNTNIEGIHEWKFEFITKEFSPTPTSYRAQIRFIDNNNLEKEYKDTTSIGYNGLSFSFNFNHEPKNVNSYNIAEILTFKGQINNNFNLLKIKSVPEASNGLGLYYIMDNIGFTAMNNNLSDSIQIKINGKIVNFTKNGWSAESLASGQVSKADPLLQKLLEKTDTYEDCFSSSSNKTCAYFRSDITNEDGDYYWIVLSRDTAYRAENLYNSVYDYVDSRSDQMSRPAEWEFTLLNAKGSNIELTWDQNLQYYDRVSERIDNYSNYDSDRPIKNYGSVLLSRFYVNDYYYQTGYSPGSLFTPLRIKGEVLNDNYIKWEMKIDTQYIHTLLETDSGNSNLSILKYLLLNFKIPSSHFISSGYYDVNTNSVVQEETSNSISTTKVSSCIEGKYNTYNNSTYDLFECAKYEEGASLTSSQIGFSGSSSYPDLKYLGHIDNIGVSGSYNRYSAGFLPKSINALQGDQKGEIRLVFFTKSNEIGSSEQTIYVDAIGSNKRKSYGRSDYVYDNRVPYFSITNKASISKADVSKVLNGTLSNDSNIIKSWNLFVNNTIASYPMSNVFEETRISHNNYPDVYNGKYQFTDKFSTTTDEERIIAENTKIKKISISNSNNYTKYWDRYNNIIGINSYNTSIGIDNFDNLTQDENGYYKICHSNAKQFCMKVRYNYGDDCPTYNKNDVNCTKYENMKYGFEVITEGFNKSFYPVFTYETETDIEKVAEGISVSSLNNNKIEMENIVKQYDWRNSPSTKSLIKTKATYELLADLAIKKKVDKASDTNYKNDTKTHELVATIGHSSSKYLDIIDFIDGIGSIDLDDTSPDSSLISTDLNDLKEIRKYLHPNDITIQIKNHYDEDKKYNTIYSNGSFIDEYNESTLDLLNTGNELYKLHLVKSNGENIPSLVDVKINYNMNFYLDENASYRLKDIYKGKKFYISTNAKGVRTYDSSSNEVGSTTVDGVYENKIDLVNKTLTTYASNKGVEIGADYLYPPEIEKYVSNHFNSSSCNWQVKYIVNSMGKDKNVTMNISDSYDLEIEGESEYEDKIIDILKKNTLYKNIKIYYDGKNTTLDNNPIYEMNSALESASINVNNIKGTLTKNGNSFDLKLSSFNYGDVVLLTYDIDIDYESAIKELIKKGYIDEKLLIKDTNKKLIINFKNKVIDVNYPESFVEKASSKISLEDYTPSIHKKNNGTQNSETSWEVSFNTGISDNDITVDDNVVVDAEDNSLKKIIEDALIIKDLEIKINNNVVYANDKFVDYWYENIDIKEKKIGYDITFKNSANNEFINQNQKVVITYKTSLDYNKYKGKQNSGMYSLINTANLKKNDLDLKDVVQASGINYEFPLKCNKEYLGNSENDLTETNWKYTIESGKMDRENVKVVDESILGSEFGKYLSISKLKIILEDEVIYDSVNNINNLGDISLLDESGNQLLLNKNGVYQFNLKLEKLSKMSTLTVEYSLKVDKDEYILNNEILDNELLVRNKLSVTSDDGTDISKETNGSAKVTSKIIKKFDFLGYDQSGNPKIKWYINVNLLNNYNIEDLEGKTIIIKDVLSDILEADLNSVQLKKMTVTSNGEVIGNNIDSNNYELSTEDNTISIRLLNPAEVNSFQISFETISYASLSELENYATLQVGEEINEIKSKKGITIFSPYASGVVSSREILSYNVKAKKLLDGKLSNKEFVFDIIETDENGQIKENGFHSQNTNASDGMITFNALEYSNEGLYYYKIKELDTHEDNIIYDNNEYLLRVKVIESHGKFVIEDISLINNDNEEIVFNNQTKQEEINDSIFDIIVNPPTHRFYIFLVIIALIGSVLVFTNKNKYTR